MTTRREKANAIRALSMDAVQKAGSGHPGAPMGMADIAEVLWTDFLIHNPANPRWFNRDRFVLSNGHGSMLIYSLLHLTGYDVSIDDIRDFRQLGSKTPGHPEYGDTPGVETTTGPLGQGLANAVGMALAERILAERFNREQLEVVDHYTYVFVGDGCLMEGVSHEAASLAGTWKLGKLICLYDDNGISIDGEVSGWFTDDTVARFNAYGWHVVRDVDGHDGEAIRAALESARQEDSRPTLICCKTEIGFGAPGKAGTAAAHGSPLGNDEISGTRERLAWSHEPFQIPQDIYDAWDCRRSGAEHESRWQQQFAEYRHRFPEAAAEFERTLAGELPAQWGQVMDELLRKTSDEGAAIASRNASGAVIAAMASILPELIGGSADLSGSNSTQWPDARTFSARPAGSAGGNHFNYINYGVREFGMTAIANGIALHGGFIPFTGTFLTFMEYARNAVRMASLMGIHNIMVYTHDSIGQGEDGPTHQPVEQLANLRYTPDLSTWRPCDSVETVVAWRSAVERSGPTALVFSRQALTCQSRTDEQLENIARGGYVLKDPDNPVAIIIATGSEVGIAVEAFEQLSSAGVAARVVSMPSADVFEAQPQTYRDQVLPPGIRCRLAVEAAHPDYWRKWVGLDGDVVGLPTFGASGPGAAVFEHFGFTADRVADAVRRMI
ncbi:MAG: transketolase [Proteobacteria bacterium]|jgi:transketolase|nr:transketolase [Pseudomonadota bacterium]MDA1299888.1 transketolase [Pseudomonadota bacterium]